MRIAFIVIGNSRRSSYLNGYSLRYGGAGGSGTDSSSIIVAEYLAKQGHEVVFVFDKLEPALEIKEIERGNEFIPGKLVNGVTYTYIGFENIENLEFDILISSLWFEDYKKIPIKVTKALIYWCHMQWIYGIGELIDFAKVNNINLGFVHISDWEKSMNSNTYRHATELYKGRVFNTLIPNPILDDVVEEVLAKKIEKKKHKFVFHASWPRGGEVAYRAFLKLESEVKEFHAFDYLMVIGNHREKFFHRHEGVDKKTLFEHLAEAEYFVYPLYTPYQDVHKDTFSCVVAEAIALGVIPITYPLGALPDNFGKHCQWIDMPIGSDIETMQKEALSKDTEGIFKENIDAIYSKIEELENNPVKKQKLIEGGQNYILSNFNSEKIGQMWIEFIEKII